MSVATKADDPEIRRLLGSSALPGAVRLSLEREPDSAIAGAIEGDVHGVIVARERRSGRLAAIASRSVRDRFVNGRPTRVGYLGQLRIDPAFQRQRGLLDAGFAFCRSLHESGGARVYLASVTASNAAARRLLERGLPGWPRFEAVDRFVSLAIPSSLRSTAAPGGAALVNGASAAASDLATCLERFNQRYQFAPCWTAADLRSPIRLRGLEPADFVVAVKHGAIVGCAACWDQRAFKQVVVRGYTGPLRRWRAAVNLVAPLLGTPVLPPAGEALNVACLSHLAVDGDDPDLFIALVAAVRRRAKLAGLDSIVLGLSGSGTLVPAIQRAYPHRSYETIIYAAAWPDGDQIVAALDSRPSHPELAIL